MEITGTIIYVDLEGGFWGIEGDDERQYYPVNELPQALKKAGTRIRATVEPAMVMTTLMWGRTVEVKQIEVLD